jgi:hypothetical protein
MAYAFGGGEAYESEIVDGTRVFGLFRGYSAGLDDGGDLM